ncbi:hypothetical protein J6590_054568 [Homalodisca vitripennis]|nr:hypothetical protein J6590_054568 [Homalodisca vitripennis]
MASPVLAVFIRQSRPAEYKPTQNLSLAAESCSCSCVSLVWCPVLRGLRTTQRSILPSRLLSLTQIVPGPVGPAHCHLNIENGSSSETNGASLNVISLTNTTAAHTGQEVESSEKLRGIERVGGREAVMMARPPPHPHPPAKVTCRVQLTKRMWYSHFQNRPHVATAAPSHNLVRAGQRLAALR